VSEIKDGGPAFPHPDYLHSGDNGMTLLDWFAGQELAKTQGTAICDRPEMYDRLADHCYRMARAMLKAKGAA
jgi:hypothetical protein